MELAWGPRDLTAQRRYPQRNQHLHWGRDKTPLFSPESRRPPSPQLSILPKAARIPELRAASGVPAAARHHLPGCWWLWVTWQRGEKCRARMAPRFPGKSWRQAGRRRREALGRGAGRPRQPASAPSTPHWSRRGEGAGGAALTSLRAVPAREGGAGSRSEPGEAARRREPPHHRRRARLPRLSAVRPAGQGAWRAAAARPEPADASHQGPKPLSSQLPHPRRCLAGPRPPSRSVSAPASCVSVRPGSGV